MAKPPARRVKAKTRTAKMWCAGKVNPRDAVHLYPWIDYAKHYSGNDTATRVTITWTEPARKERKKP